MNIYEMLIALLTEIDRHAEAIVGHAMIGGAYQGELQAKREQVIDELIRHSRQKVYLDSKELAVLDYIERNRGAIDAELEGK